MDAEIMGSKESGNPHVLPPLFASNPGSNLQSGEAPIGQDAGFQPGVNKVSRSTLRIRYESEVELIRRRFGSLEKIRGDLGLSARKICQLLLVDPSAWNRWTKRDLKAPPHIWRALEWYLIAAEKMPGLTPGFFLERPAVRLDQAASNQVKNLEGEYQKLIDRLQAVENRSETIFAELKSAQRTIRVYELAGTMIALILMGFVGWLFMRTRI